MATFDQLESGRHSRPADLYRFEHGTEVFRYTSDANEITFQGGTYTPLELKRSAPVMNPAARTSNKLTLQSLATARPFTDFIGIQPASVLTCTITRIQLEEGGGGSPDVANPTTGFVLFEGYVTSVSFTGRTCELDMNPYSQQFTREIPRYKYQSLCNHVLYDTFCLIDKNLFSQVGLVNGVSGNDISVNGFTGTAFIGGYVKDAAGTDFRMIIDHSGDTFTLLLPFRSILGETVTAYQGCDHAVQTCKSKFNNVPRFGGFPLVPGVNPFSQSQFTKT